LGWRMTCSRNLGEAKVRIVSSNDSLSFSELINQFPFRLRLLFRVTTGLPAPSLHGGALEPADCALVAGFPKKQGEMSLSGSMYFFKGHASLL